MVALAATDWDSLCSVKAVRAITMPIAAMTPTMVPSPQPPSRPLRFGIGPLSVTRTRGLIPRVKQTFVQKKHKAELTSNAPNNVSIPGRRRTSRAIKRARYPQIGQRPRWVVFLGRGGAFQQSVPFSSQVSMSMEGVLEGIRHQHLPFRNAASQRLFSL